KDCAQNVKNQSKTGQYQHKIGSLQQKPDQQVVFNNQPMKLNCQKNQSCLIVVLKISSSVSSFLFQLSSEKAELSVIATVEAQLDDKLMKEELMDL
nr:hypothetical protein [Tanacetum cinerariifolium]